MAHTRCTLDKQGTRKNTHAHAHAPAITHTDKYVVLIAFPRNCYANAPQCYVIHILPVLFKLVTFEQSLSWRGSVVRLTKVNDK